jgi:hypothetical protein
MSVYMFIHLQQATSMLTWVDQKFEGTQNIVTHLTTGLHVVRMKHHVLSVDAQPSGCGGLMVLVTGTSLA